MLLHLNPPLNKYAHLHNYYIIMTKLMLGNKLLLPLWSIPTFPELITITRIDHVFLLSRLLPKLLSVKIVSTSWSDHDPVVLTLFTARLAKPH